MEAHSKRTVFLTAALCLLILLAACNNQATEIAVAPPTTHPMELTAVALLTKNAELVAQVTELAAALQQIPKATATEIPTATLVPTLSPTPGPTISVPEELETITHALSPTFVLAYDPNLWRLEDAVDPSMDFLVNRNMAQCKVNIATQPLSENLVTYYPELIGRRGWLVQQDTENTYYTHQDLTVKLIYNENADCLAFQRELLSTVYSLEEVSGAPASTPVATPTIRPTPDGFVCEGALPPRLESGDRVMIVTAALWLRSEARIDEETQLKLLPLNIPAEITVTGEQVCVDGTIFYPVTVQEFVVGAEPVTGWVAESGNNVYYLDIWYLGW